MFLSGRSVRRGGVARLRFRESGGLHRSRDTGPGLARKVRSPCCSQLSLAPRATAKLPAGIACFPDVLESFCRGVAQPGSAPALGAGGPRFESARPDQPTLPVHAQLPRWRSGFQQRAQTPAERLNLGAGGRWFESNRPHQNFFSLVAVRRRAERVSGFGSPVDSPGVLTLDPARSGRSGVSFGSAHTAASLRKSKSPRPNHLPSLMPQVYFQFLLTGSRQKASE